MTVLGILIDQIYTSESLNHELGEFKLGITNGKLSPLLIPHHVMYTTLTDIQAMIQNKFSSFHLSVDDIKDVYNSIKFLYTKLYVTITLPISNFDKPLKVYKFLSMSVPINAISEHVTQIFNLPEYCLITSNHQYYADASDFDISLCGGNNIC